MMADMDTVRLEGVPTRAKDARVIDEGILDPFGMELLVRWLQFLPGLQVSCFLSLWDKP